MQIASRFGRSLPHVVALLLLSVAASASFAQEEMQSSLRQHYAKRVWVLRHFYADSKLRFDKEGKLLGDAGLGHCTSDSTIYIAGLTVDDNNVLTLKGKRILNMFDEKNGSFKNLVTKEPIQVTVELDPTWNDALNRPDSLRPVPSQPILSFRAKQIYMLGFPQSAL